MASSYKKEDRAVLHLELKGDNTGELSGKLVKSYIDANKLDNDDFLISSFNWKELEEMRKVVPTLKIALLDGAIRRKELAPKLESDESIFSEIFAYGEEDYMLPFSSNLEEAIDVVNQKVKIENDRKILVEEVKKALTGQYYDDSLIEAALNMKAFSINLWFKTVSKEYIEKAHKKGLKVFLFTVNEKKDIDSVKDLNPDGIFTDYYLDTKTYYESLNT